MSHEAPKIQIRHPRYILQLADRKVLRYTNYPRGQRAFFTEIQNLSETGMAFTVPYLDTPNISETIMVEFTPPGSESSMACFGKVLRVQDYTIIESDFFQKNCKLVAVRFIDLHEKQTEFLRQSLNGQFAKMNKVFGRQQFKMKILWWLKFRRKQMYMVAFAGVAALGFLISMIKFLNLA